MKNDRYSEALLKHRQESGKVFDQASYLRKVFYTVMGAAFGFVAFAALAEYMA